MTVLTHAEVSEWCKGPSWQGPECVNFDGQDFFLTHPEATCIYLKHPATPDRLPHFARTIADIGPEHTLFDGALLLFTEWGVWNGQDEGIGYRIIERLNGSAGQPASFEAAPGHQFRADEFNEAVGMLLQPILFGWDAFFLPRRNAGLDEFFLFVSHDGYVIVVTRTKEFYDTAFKGLEDSKLEPRQGAPRAERFCRRL